MAKRILLSFTGFHDPYGDSPIDGAKDAGPILQMLACRPFDHVYLFQTPKLVERTERTIEEIQKRFPEITVEVTGSVG